MTLREILEGYGIDFNTLTFETIKNCECCSVEEIKKSMETNEIVVDFTNYEEMETTTYCIDDFDIDDLISKIEIETRKYGH